jgi:hypothetical protein
VFNSKLSAPDLDSPDEICLPPSAAELLESMRALGYSFEAALADLIDNSISADAVRIEVHCSPYDDQPYVAVLDNGRGMDPHEITSAMRHGSRDPKLAREIGDLGRFGLGLKTASLSQCRRLTVVSLKSGEVSARRWDLDHVASRQDWMLLQLNETQMRTLPLIQELLDYGHGTLVIWEEFDRLIADGTPLDRALGTRLDVAREHLALVFHRFLHPTPGHQAVQISLNGNPLHAIDPFLRDHRATQALPVEEYQIDQEIVIVTPFILPHLSKLQPTDRELAGGDEGLRRNQGFYIYRHRRLISWGSWFRLVRQEELTKLARVQVDISNRLDHLWQLDIKKSRTYPPESLREALRQIIHRITEGSRRVYTYRGRKASDGITRTWERTAEREGVTYTVNRSHPLLVALAGTHSRTQSLLFNQLIRVLEESIPFDAVYADMASELRPNLSQRDDRTEESLLALARSILESLGRDTPEGQRFLHAMATIEPFSSAPEYTQTLRDKLQS